MSETNQIYFTCSNYFSISHCHAISVDNKMKKPRRENETDNLDLVHETRGLLIASATIANRYQWPVGAGLISFRFTHPSKFSIAIKYRERRGLHSRRWAKRERETDIGRERYEGDRCEGDGAKRGMRCTRVTTAGLFSVDARTPSLKQYPRPCTRSPEQERGYGE